MPYIPILLLAVCQLSQAPETKQPEKSAPAVAPANPAEAADPAAKDGASTEEAQTEADKFLAAAADKLDKLAYVSAELRQVIRLGGQDIPAEGTYKKGPDYRTRFELNVSLGDAIGKHLVVCDGKTGYRFEKILDTEVLQSFKIDQIMPLIDRKELPAPVQRQLYAQLPFVRPGDMLRGYLDTITFTKMVSGTFGDRKVKVLEGHWKKSALQALANKPDIQNVDALGGNMPQYVRLYIDEETGWPVRTELFRRNTDAELKPVYILEFLKLTLPKTIPQKDFEFTPPANVVPQDVTAFLTSQLQTLKDRPDAKPATISPAAGAVSEPLSLPGVEEKKDAAPKPKEQ